MVAAMVRQLAGSQYLTNTRRPRAKSRASGPPAGASGCACARHAAGHHDFDTLGYDSCDRISG